MSGTLINLIIQIIAGVAGGHAVGATVKNFAFGATGNTIAGALGGAIGVSFFKYWYRRWRPQRAMSTLRHLSARSSAAALEALF
jgi:uncharacterized membrane protein YeaQ/YmgE (transglycosylase-associated protein family)